MMRFVLMTAWVVLITGCGSVSMYYDVPVGWRASTENLKLESVEPVKAEKKIGDKTWTFFGLQLTVRNDSNSDFVLQTSRSSIIVSGKSHAVFPGTATILDRNSNQEIPIAAQASTKVILFDKEYTEGYTFSHRFGFDSSKSYFQKRYETKNESDKQRVAAEYKAYIKKQLNDDGATVVRDGPISVRLVGETEGKWATIVFKQVYDLSQGNQAKGLF